MSIARNYQHLLREIAEEADRAGRDPADIKLIVVSKTHPWDYVKEVYSAGCRHFGENRVQEALEKKAEAPADINWHLIGTLQKNKINKVIGEFALIHSVDSLDLASKINEASSQRNVITSILLQVNVSGEATKHGFTAESITDQFNVLKALPSVKIEGLMTMAPFTNDRNACLSCFQKLAELRETLALRELSMGMSNDWREAIQAGSTILRLGSAIFGSRTIKGL